MPTIRVPFVAPSPPILPLSLPNNSSSSRLRSASRRLNYNLKSRASHYSFPVVLGGLCAVLFLVFQFTRSPLTPHSPHLYSRSEGPSETSADGISILVDHHELIAEDDLFFDAYNDPDPDELEAEKQHKLHRLDVQQRDHEHALRALIWWIAEGGIFPSDWHAPSADDLKRIRGRRMEQMLEGVDKGEEEPMFDVGWTDYAETMYRAVVFSKTYCPHSKRAKAILDTYHLTPAPFVIELDVRPDTQTIQNLLHGLTGRRTVPNVILDFTSLGGADDVSLLHAEGGLQRRFEEMEMVPGARKRRKPPKKRPQAEPVPKVKEPNPELVVKKVAEPVFPADAIKQGVNRAIDEAYEIAVEEMTL